jgi:hypothetical protein
MNWLKRLLTRWGLLKKKAKPQPESDFGQATPTTTDNLVAVDGRRFAHGGKRLVPVIDTAWQILKLTNGDLGWYLDTRKAQGFNVIQFGEDGQAFNTDGNPVAWCMGKLAAVLDAIEARGMFAMVGVGLHRYGTDGKPFINVSTGNERKVGETFAKWLARDCVLSIYINGMDDKIGMDRLLRLAEGVRAGAPGHMISWHPRHGAASYPAVAPGPLCSFVAVQSGHRDLGREAAYRLVKACPDSVPVVDIEPCYEGMPQYGNASHVINADDVERAVAGAVDAGAAGVGYGHHLVWGFAPGWKDAVWKAPGARRAVQQARRIA